MSEIICTTVEKEIKEILTVMMDNNESNHVLLYKRMDKIDTEVGKMRDELTKLDIRITDKVLDISKEALKQAHSMPIGGAIAIAFLSSGFVGLAVYFLTHIA